MAGADFDLPWNSQPQEVVKLDPAFLYHTLAAANAGAGQFELVSGALILSEGGRLPVSSIAGLGFDSTAISSQWKAAVSVPRVAERLARTLIWHGVVIGAETGSTPSILSLAKNPAAQDDAHASFLRSGDSLVVGFSFNGTGISSRTYAIGLTGLYGRPLTLVWCLNDLGANTLYVGVGDAVVSYTGTVLASTGAPAHTGAEALIFGPDNAETTTRNSNVIGASGAYLNIGLDRVTAELLAGNPWRLFESRSVEVGAPTPPVIPYKPTHFDLPWTQQPQGQPELDETHWLYKDLVFVHNGVQGYVNGVAVDPVTSVAPTPLGGHPLGGPFAQSIAFKGNNASYLEYKIPATSYPVTISTWDIVNGTDLNGSALLGIGFASGRSGVYLARGGNYTNELAFGSSTGDAVTTVSSSGFAQTDTLRHSVGVGVNSALRNLYVDGGLAATDTVNSASGGNLVGILCHRGFNSFQISKPITTFTAFQMVISRALSAAEVARLYAEQRENPWSIFKSQHIFVQVPAEIIYVLCVEAGILVYRALSPAERKVYVSATGALLAKTADASAGERRLTLVNGKLEAS